MRSGIALAVILTGNSQWRLEVFDAPSLSPLWPSPFFQCRLRGTCQSQSQSQILMPLFLRKHHIHSIPSLSWINRCGVILLFYVRMCTAYHLILLLFVDYSCWTNTNRMSILGFPIQSVFPHNSPCGFGWKNPLYASADAFRSAKGWSLLTGEHGRFVEAYLSTSRT